MKRIHLQYTNTFIKKKGKEKIPELGMRNNNEKT